MAAPLLYYIWSWQQNNSINCGHSYLLVAGKTTGLNSFGLMWCNGTTAAPKINLIVQFYWHSPMDIICISTGWILCWESVILLIRYNSWRLYEWESWLCVPIFLRQSTHWVKHCDYFQALYVGLFCSHGYLWVVSLTRPSTLNPSTFWASRY